MALTFEKFSRLREVTKVLHHLTAAMSDLKRNVDFLKSNVRRSEPRSGETNECANGGFGGGRGGRGEGVRGPAEGVGAATVLSDLQRDVTEMRREMNDIRRDMKDFRRDMNDFRQEMRIKEASCAPAPEMRVNVKEASCAPSPNSVVAELVGGGGTETHRRRRWLSKDADKKGKGKERAMARGEGTDAGMTSIVFPKAERQVLGFWERFRV
jgi:hypothetical protein